MDNLEQALLESENSLMLLSDEELITPINDILIINPETRLIEVPNTELLLGVFGENLVEKKYFKCPRIVLNNIDLYECFIFINYVSANGRIGSVQSENVELDETEQYILFDWDLTSNVFDKNKDSTIYFSVSAKQYLEDSEPVFATRKAQGKMYETINGTEHVTQEHADIILQILAGMKTKVDLPKDEDGNLLVPEEGQTLLFREDGTTYYGTPSSGGGTSFSGSAKDVTYDDTETKLGTENVQDAIGKLSEEIGDLTEPRTDDIPKVFFTGIAPTTKAQDELPLTMEYHSKTKTIKSFVTLKVQGDSSASYPKKNFNIKMFSDEARTEKLKCTFRNWDKTHKYCLKANWIDHTHARNVVNGRLWGQVVKSRSDYENYPTEYKESANSGAVDGFPIKVYINGIYQGIYTWNIRKDGSMFNMDDETGVHSALIADGVNAVTAWRELPTIGNGDWTDELNDTVPDAVRTSFQNAYSFVINSTDEEFVNNIEQHFYLSSLIDYYIFIYSILMFGGLAKSQTMFTYDANKWLANIYDMDTTWALYWNGKSFVSTSMACPEGYEHTAGYNLLYERLVALFPDRIKERYAELRSTVLSDGNIINEFERFMDVIPLNLYAEDFAETTANGAFTEIPSKDTNNLQKLRDVIVKRMAYCDEQIPLIGSTVEKIPATGITLSSTTLSFTDSASQTLTATLEPSNTTDRVIWSSNNDEVATVTNGVVKPISNGSATITAIAGNVSATCEVAVNVEELVVLTGLTATYTGGEVIEGTVLTDLTGITVTATYSNGTTANVTDYTLSGTIKVGENTITVSYEDKTTTFVVTGTEIDYGEALYPLTDGVFTPMDNQPNAQPIGCSVEITNGNHVKITGGETTKNAIFVNLTNPDKGYVNNLDKVFSFPAGANVKYKISNLTTNMTAAGFRVANSSSGISTLAINNLSAPGGNKEATVSADTDIGAVFIYGNVLAGATIEFDVSLIVNNQRYI